jgi:carboxymethylenebutenolidase
MKIFLLILTSFLAAGLVSLTLKKTPSPVKVVQQSNISCMLEDVREIARTEAATKEFAALHKEPLAFKLEELAGKRVSFTTPDGKSASAYEIRNKKKTHNYLLVIPNGMAE